MQLKIVLPLQIFADISGVSKLVAESDAGSFGILEHRLDCVATLVPGILTYATAALGEIFVAVDRGILVKTGTDVLVSVRRAIGGVTMVQLRDAVKKEFLTWDEHERGARSVMAKLEIGLLGRLSAFSHE